MNIRYPIYEGVYRILTPYAGYVLNLQKLKAYNRLMFPLAMALNREL